MLLTLDYSMLVESEKVLERKLCTEVKSLGGWAVKLLSGLVTGLPDRLILLPGGVVAFVEVKTTGKKVTKLQGLIHARLRCLGFRVEVIDSSEKINNLIRSFMTVLSLAEAYELGLIENEDQKEKERMSSDWNTGRGFL